MCSNRINDFSVSFVAVLRDAVQHIPNLIADLEAQDFPHEKLEILIIDGMSKDNSSKVAESLLSETDLTYRILNNPGLILATGWNVALSEARNDIILRIDAHSRFESNFISNNVRAHQKGEYITGGPMISVSGEGPGGIILAIESSIFGAGGASHRNYCDEPTYVDTVSHGAYRREVFAKVGGYNKFLIRNQDNEMHFRIKQAGYRFYFDPSIQSKHFVRSSSKTFFYQKFRIGYWIALTTAIQPRCFAPRHFIPFAFLMSIIIGIAIVVITGQPWPLLLSVVPYSVLAIYFSFQSALNHKPKKPLWIIALPFLFFITHIIYGLGTIFGIIRMPFFMLSARGHKIPFPLCPDQDDFSSKPHNQNRSNNV